MAKKKLKNPPTKITKEQLHKMDKAARRQAMIDVGQRTTPANKVHKSKKDYTRKPRNPNPPDKEE